MPFLDRSTGGKIFYEDHGNGVPILFLHGWCMSSAIWRLQQSAVSGRFRFIAPDLCGHGQSSLPTSGINGFSSYASDILELVESLELSGIVAVGWSLGGQVLLKAYPSLAARLAGVALVGATPRFSSAPHFPFGVPPEEASGMRLKVRRSLDRALDGFHKRIFAESELSVQSRKEVESVLAGVIPPSTVAALEGLDALMTEELMEEAGLVTVPALIIHGEMDGICLPEASIWLERVITGSRRICYEGCGHAPFISRYQRFNADLLEFAGQVHLDD